MVKREYYSSTIVLLPDARRQFAVRFTPLLAVPPPNELCFWGLGS